MKERVIRQAARQLLPKLVSPLDAEDLFQVARVALWKVGDVPESHQFVVARSAMIDELRRHRWVSRSKYSETSQWQMATCGDHPAHDWSADCHSASLIAVRQCIARLQRLPDRERQILDCLALGMDQQEVAEQIGLSPQRVGQLIAELRAIVARYV